MTDDYFFLLIDGEWNGMNESFDHSERGTLCCQWIRLYFFFSPDINYIMIDSMLFILSLCLNNI